MEEGCGTPPDQYVCNSWGVMYVARVYRQGGVRSHSPRCVRTFQHGCLRVTSTSVHKLSLIALPDNVLSSPE